MAHVSHVGEDTWRTSTALGRFGPPHPAHFDIHREAHPHLAFGQGQHTCVGNTSRASKSAEHLRRH